MQATDCTGNEDRQQQCGQQM